jgi:hypothetical protein
MASRIKNLKKPRVRSRTLNVATNKGTAALKPEAHLRPVN